ncbi:MAG: site-2 protease family protein [Actinomycetota bacterium]
MNSPIQMLIDGQLALFVIFAAILVLALSLHEFGHALAADLQGDRTARLAGRLTLNPLKHLDPFGTFALLFAGFGWGKPVPFSPRALRNQRFGPAIVGFAGPIVNIVLAFMFAALYGGLRPGPGSTLETLLIVGVQLNVVLAIFNLMPIPPLDGSRILSAVLPPSKQHIVYFLDKWGFVLLLVFVFFLFRPVLGPLITFSTRRLLLLFL